MSMVKSEQGVMKMKALQSIEEIFRNDQSIEKEQADALVEIWL